MITREVRRKAGVPVATDFANSQGTPIVVNTSTGACYTLNDSGTVVQSLIGVTNTASLTFGTIAANGVAEQTMTVTGATTGSAVCLGAPAAIESGLTWSAFVSATNTITVRAHNNTGGNVTPAVATWRATVIL